MYWCEVWCLLFLRFWTPGPFSVSSLAIHQSRLLFLTIITSYEACTWADTEWPGRGAGWITVIIFFSPSFSKSDRSEGLDLGGKKVTENKTPLMVHKPQGKVLQLPHSIHHLDWPFVSVSHLLPAPPPIVCPSILAFILSSESTNIAFFFFFSHCRSCPCSCPPWTWFLYFFFVLRSLVLFSFACPRFAAQPPPPNIVISPSTCAYLQLSTKNVSHVIPYTLFSSRNTCSGLPFLSCSCATSFSKQAYTFRLFYLDFATLIRAILRKVPFCLINESLHLVKFPLPCPATHCPFVSIRWIFLASYIF